MKTIAGCFFGIGALLVAIDAAAQTLPPANASMGPAGTATMHANAASSNATTNRGPGSGAVSITGTSFDAVFPTILMGSDGMIVSVATKWTDRTPYVYLLNPTTLEPLATMRPWPRPQAGATELGQYPAGSALSRRPASRGCRSPTTSSTPSVSTRRPARTVWSRSILTRASR